MKNNYYDCFTNSMIKWSVDWENFDWEIVREKLEIAEKEFEQNTDMKTRYDIGITEEQFKEFLHWFQKNAPEEYNKFMLYMVLREKGLEKEDIYFCLSHPDKLEQAIDILQRENK